MFQKTQNVFRKNKQPIEITILPEDCENDDYMDITDCGLARAVKRHAITQFPNVGESVINDFQTNKTLGEIKPKFSKEDWNNLKSGEIKEFKTTFYLK